MSSDSVRLKCMVFARTHTGTCAHTNTHTLTHVHTLMHIACTHSHIETTQNNGRSTDGRRQPKRLRRRRIKRTRENTRGESLGEHIIFHTHTHPYTHSAHAFANDSTFAERQSTSEFNPSGQKSNFHTHTHTDSRKFTNRFEIFICIHLDYDAECRLTDTHTHTSARTQRTERRIFHLRCADTPVVFVGAGGGKRGPMLHGCTDSTNHSRGARAEFRVRLPSP